MSSNHHLGHNAPVKGEIDHITYLSQHIGSLYLKEDYSDIILKVDSHRFHGHKVILAARSEYFRALLFGGMKESTQSEIELKGTSISAFKGLLKYIYTGQMSLTSLKEDIILDILGLAHQYGFVDLESSISEFLRQVLNINNVCAIFDAARLYQLHYLTKVSATFMDCWAPEIIAHESFTQLSVSGLKELIDRDSFYAPEVDIFRAVVEWSKSSGLTAGPELDSVLSCVRLQLMNTSDLLNVVRPLKLVTSDTILDAITMRTSSRDSNLCYRGALRPEENVAHVKYGTQVLQGEMRAALLDGDSHNYDMERGYTRHAINEAGDGGILIKLGQQSIVNHIKLLLWDRDTRVPIKEDHLQRMYPEVWSALSRMHPSRHPFTKYPNYPVWSSLLRSYSYYIEVSMDQKDWTRVIDHSNYFCRSWQYLYFEPRVVRYIRIVGTNNTANKVFHVVSFEIMYTNTPFSVDSGLIVPKHNVATNAGSAAVIEGVSRSRNALLDGDTKRYDWDSGYTCHQLGSGAILVQLGQPYLIDSMRLLLWDCDDRSYSYYVEVSVNMWDWELVWDKTRDNCRSWQYITFTRRPVVFVRIIGTHNTANEVFHCVHFECPAQIDGEGSSNRIENKTKLLLVNHNPPAITTPLPPIITAVDVILGSEAREEDNSSESSAPEIARQDVVENAVDEDET